MSQTLQLGAGLPSGTAIFSTTTPTPLPSWLLLNNSTFWIGIFNAPATLQFGIDPSFTNLAPGQYTATIKFNTIMPERTATVSITLNVTAPPPVLRTSVSSLKFSYMVGETPATQTVQITSSGSPLTAAVTLGASWLTASTMNGITPFNTNIGVNPTGLAPGTYNSQVGISTSIFGPTSSQTISVTVTVSADNRPAITSVLNAGSFKPVISPGAWVAIMGKNLATTTQQAQSLWLGTSMSGVSVGLSGIGAGYSFLVHYVSPNQVNVFVPHEVTVPTIYGPNKATLSLTNSGGTATFAVDCEPIAPALFTYGANYAAAVYPDGVIVGTMPGMRAAASKAIISLYGTGFGQTNPASTSINGPVTVRPLALESVVTVGDVPAKLLWGGMVAMGLYQFNIEVPELPAGTYPVVIQISGTQSVPVMLQVQ